MKWHDIITNSPSSEKAWEDILDSLLKLTQETTSPVALHDDTVIPDRLLSETAWELWHDYPAKAVKTSDVLKQWCAAPSSAGKAVLIMDALSLRELPAILAGAQIHGAAPASLRVTGSECPSTTEHFAHALGIPSRSALANDAKPKTFALFDACFTDVLNIPFEDCPVPPSPNICLWHSWLDDLIHIQHKLPDQIAKTASAVFQSDGFWRFISKLRQGRKLIIASDHGYAVSKRFSSEVTDPDAVDILRKTFGASRNKTAASPWQPRFMPPIVMTHRHQHVIMGQWKWKVQGGFPQICHGGLTLLEIALPILEFSPI